MKKTIVPLLSILIFICLVCSCVYQGPPLKPGTKNILKNPSFEKEHMGWASDWHCRALYEAGETEYIYETALVHSGKRAIRITNNIGNDTRVYQYIKVQPRTLYKISCWINAGDITGDVGACVAVLDSGAHSDSVRSTNGEWVQAVLYGFTGDYQTQMPVAVRIGGWASYSQGSAVFDDIEAEIIGKKPTNATVHSFMFGQDNFDSKLQLYLDLVNDKEHRFTSKSLFISVFMALLVLAGGLIFALYHFLVRRKNKEADAMIGMLFGQSHYGLVALLFLLFFLILLAGPAYLTAFDVQIFYGLFFIVALGICAYLYTTKQMTISALTKIVILLGVALRLCYFLYTAGDDPMLAVRQHDLWGAWSHTEYIKYIADKFALPPVGTHETYHPPLHYILASIIFNLARVCGLKEFMAFKAVQLYLVFISYLLIIFVYRIFKLLKADDRLTLIGVAFVCFLPSLVFMSSYLNNDLMVAFCFTVSFYYLLKWVEKKSMKHTILFGVFTALSILSKKSAVILFVIGGIVFIVELIRNRKEFRQYLKMMLVFCAVAMPLGFSFQIRNYILFQQDFAFSVLPTSSVMPHNPYNLFYVSVQQLLARPLVPEAGSERIFLMMEFIRTALFSAFMYETGLPGLNDITVVLMFFFLVNLVLVVLYLLLARKEDYSGNDYIFLVSLIASVLYYIWMHFSSPYHTTHEFRYVAPFISIPLAYFIGKANLKFSSIKFPVLGYIVKYQFVGFCLASALFIALVGFDHAL